MARWPKNTRGSRPPAILDKYLKDQRDKKARMVVAIRNKDLHFLLLTSSWPTHRNPNIFFSEHILSLLAIPCVIFMVRVWEKIGNLKEDQFSMQQFRATISRLCMILSRSQH